MKLLNANVPIVPFNVMVFVSPTSKYCAPVPAAPIAANCDQEQLSKSSTDSVTDTLIVSLFAIYAIVSAMLTVIVAFPSLIPVIVISLPLTDTVAIVSSLDDAVIPFYSIFLVPYTVLFLRVNYNNF